MVGVHAHPLSLRAFTVTSKVAVYAPAEWADTLALFHLFPSFAGFWYPAKNMYFISVSGAILGTSLPPTPNWSRFDLFIDVYSILFIVFLATHCILFIVFLHVIR
jgi:hypothetical protein